MCTLKISAYYLFTSNMPKTFNIYPSVIGFYWLAFHMIVILCGLSYFHVYILWLVRFKVCLCQRIPLLTDSDQGTNFTGKMKCSQCSSHICYVTAENKKTFHFKFIFVCVKYIRCFLNKPPCTSASLLTWMQDFLKGNLLTDQW